MKLHFEPNLDYQMQAIEAVCDLFRGQEVCRTEFTVTMKLPDDVQMSLGVAQSDLGVGNRLTLLDDELLKNLADIQLRGGLPPSSSLTSGDFTVEMETGTGKTHAAASTHHCGASARTGRYRAQTAGSCRTCCARASHYCTRTGQYG